MKKSLLNLSVLCVFVVNSFAATTLGPLFTNNAVFQREKPLAIYGTADAGTTVTVNFANTTATAQAAADGRWQVTLPAQAASADPRTLTVTTGAGEKIEIQNILVGEIWLASGQSNMEWGMSQVADSKNEIAAVNYPQIRMVRVPLNPRPKLTYQLAKPLVWQEANPKNAVRFSSTAYFFARELHQKLNVPVGIINAAWGGKMIEVFLSEPVLAKPEFKKVHENYADEIRRFTPKLEAEKKIVAEWNAEKAAAEKAGQPFTKKYPLGNLTAQAILDQHLPSCLFNGGINPLGAYTLRGIIWYQGEHNTMRSDEYPPLFTALIADWRAFFAQGDIPFYFCQLSGYGAPMDRSGESYSKLREAQRQVAAANIPNTGMVVTVDLGEKADVHFRNKKPVGQRLALLARHFTYGEKQIEYSGPVLTNAARQAAAAKLTFAHADGLHLTETPTAAFELAGADKKFHPATPQISGNTITLVSDKVPSPKYVRYAWGNFPESKPLFNSDKLPASPFTEELK